MERISITQLFMLTLLFQIGSSGIFGFASAAGKDAWLSVLLSTALGTCLIGIFLILMRLQPGLTLVEWFPAQFGQWLGTPISWFYMLMFLYNSSRTLGDVKDLIPTTILPGTPNWVILSVFMIAIAYALFSGIEVIARLGEIILPVLLVLFLVEIVLIFGSDTIRIERLQPVLGEGWDRVWEGAWPSGAQQSFAETLEFAMIWTLTKQPERIAKTTILATLLYGILLSTFDALAILTFGEEVFSSSTYPLYRLVKTISIADFLENLDALGILYFMGFVFFKVTLQMYGVIRGIQQLLYLSDSRVLVFPVSVIVLILGLTESESTSEHIASGLGSLAYPSIVPWFLIPSLLLIVTCIRKGISGKQMKKSRL
ncbi:GerAB/ArcD/ProY family transporter [Ectobacillus funiculus]|uniref:GerAB/ArcD/ProY family transporter n=1 Tax=Ectobacillus funiculus TaxID=137993 RepID=UPI00101BA536|nr:endospore germination permease [Ectobacillus funiculus]